MLFWGETRGRMLWRTGRRCSRGEDTLSFRVARSGTKRPAAQCQFIGKPLLSLHVWALRTGGSSRSSPLLHLRPAHLYVSDEFRFGDSINTHNNLNVKIFFIFKHFIRSVHSGITYILNIKIQFLVAELGAELSQVGLVYVRLAEDVLSGEDFLFCAIG